MDSVKSLILHSRKITFLVQVLFLNLFYKTLFIWRENKTVFDN